MRLREPRWERYIHAAVGRGEPVAPSGGRARITRKVSALLRRLSEAHTAQESQQEHRRADVRLLPSVAASWATAAVATSMPARTLPPVWLLLIPLALGLLAMVLARPRPRLFARPRPFALARSFSRARSGRAGHRYPRAVRGSPGGALVLAALCAAAVIAVVGLRMQLTTVSPLGREVMSGRELLVTVVVTGTPRQLEPGNGPAGVVIEATIIKSSAAGHITTGRVPVRVVAGSAWAGVREGQEMTTVGKVRLAAGNDSRQASLRPATAPLPASGPGHGPASSSGGNLPLTAVMRTAWTAAAQKAWSPLSADAAALLPGMVMGDRGAIDSTLNESMKVVGLTHLTAVSGANCTLVLASLMLALRSMRTPRTVAFGVCLAGLGGFVILVGPDPSVLRAAVMGGIGAMALLSGRPKRVGVLLSLSIVVLLLADPWLAADYAFILSVLATLGLHLVGRRCVAWLAVPLPLWLAQAIAIPLAAQLFCAPVIVLLAARLTPYTVVANMAAAPVIALVTTVGTLGLVSAVLLPPVAVFCAAISGAGAWWVAAVARWMSSLPAASLPWPEGAVGVVLMATMNAAVLLGLVAWVEKSRTAALVELMLGHVPPVWRRRHGFTAIVVLCAAATFLWTAAVVSR